MVVIHHLLVDVVVVSLEMVGELVRVAHHIIVAHVAVRPTVMPRILLPQMLGRGRRCAAIAAVGIAILRIILRLLVAVDVPDAGDRLQPRGDSGRTADAANNANAPNPNMDGGQGRHRRPMRQGGAAGLRQFRNGLRVAGIVNIAGRRLLLVRRAGQVGHAGLIEGAFPAVTRAVAVAVAVIVIVAVATADGTSRQRRGGPGRSQRGRGNWNITVVVVAAAFSGRTRTRVGIVTGRPTQSTKHCV